MKVICQNCYEILAERNMKNGYFKYDPDKVESILQEIDENNCILTISCPKCGCILQVKV